MTMLLQPAVLPPVFAERRRRLQQAMGTGVAIIPTAPERIRNRDSTFPFRFDSDFWYLTGFPEPEAVLVVVAGESPRSVLFCREKNEEREIWDGRRYGPDAARDAFGMDACLPIGALAEQLPELLANQPKAYFALGADPAWDQQITAALNAVRAQVRAGKRPPAEVVDVRTLVEPMRLIKDPHEIACLQRAADIASAAHRRAMAACRPGLHEYEVEAEFLHEFRRGNSVPSYAPIVAGGANACILHYHENCDLLHAGDLLLIDAGCEVDGYASDITRTFPVSGRFSAAQKDVYEIVLAAQAAAIAAIGPGANFNDPHAAALRVLTQGMVDLKLLAGSVDALIESEAYRRFYMHRTGHWLGLDVHDAGEYKAGEAWMPLTPGMVLTVEPGFYIRPADDVPEALWNIGVRIEDDVVVTAHGADVITTAPKTVADIETLMAR